VPVVGVALFLRQPDARQKVRALVGFSAGAAAAFGLSMLPGSLLHGVEFWREFRHFSGTVHQGLFAEVPRHHATSSSPGRFASRSSCLD
jgi:hypothetical protein